MYGSLAARSVYSPSVQTKATLLITCCVFADNAVYSAAIGENNECSSKQLGFVAIAQDVRYRVMDDGSRDVLLTWVSSV